MVIEPIGCDAAVVPADANAAGSLEMIRHVNALRLMKYVLVGLVDVAGIDSLSSCWISSSCHNLNLLTPYRIRENEFDFVLDRWKYTSEPMIRVLKCM